MVFMKLWFDDDVILSSSCTSTGTQNHNLFPDSFRVQIAFWSGFYRNARCWKCRDSKLAKPPRPVKELHVSTTRPLVYIVHLGHHTRAYTTAAYRTCIPGLSACLSAHQLYVRIYFCRTQFIYVFLKVKIFRMDPHFNNH